MGFFDFFSGGKSSPKKYSGGSRSPAKNGGPLVKSGPTKDQVRSRNADGTWHKKRSDAK
jgi:hypothetical protein